MKSPFRLAAQLFAGTLPMESINSSILSAPFLLFMQHGWADDNRAMLNLGKQLVGNQAPIIAPDLGYVQTWIRIAPLIQQVETVALDHITAYPDRLLRIVGHSMGGLIWLEVLHRHPEWWPQVHSLVLVASPVGGADLGRMIDPLGLGIGIAADLGTNRKPLAEAIAAQIPTLVIAGDIQHGSDGTVPVSCTRVAHTHFVSLPLDHAALRNHSSVAAQILSFWADFNMGESVTTHEVIDQLQKVPGITDSDRRYFPRAQVRIQLQDGGTLRVYKNRVGVDYVFVADAAGDCLYAGFVGWLHAPELQQALNEIDAAYAFSSSV
jgi:pimeloyl-ACP methyl ester carboxylesterase